MIAQTAPRVSTLWLRPEDQRLTQGLGQYVRNRIAQQPSALQTYTLHAAFVRSPIAHGRLISVDTAQALALHPSVQVFTGADAVDGAGQPWRMPHINPMMPLTAEGFASQCGPLLPHPTTGVLLAVDAPVVLVLALTAELAQAAAQRVVLSTQAMPAMADHARAAPTLAKQHWGEDFQSVALQTQAEPEQTKQEQPTTEGWLRVDVQHSQARVVPLALEPRAVLAQWQEDTVTAYLGAQAPSRTQEQIAQLLGLPKQQVRVVAQDVGGAYGGKSSIHPEELLVVALAHRLHTSIAWCASRSEDMTSSCHGRGGQLQGTLWVDALGRMQRVQATFDFPAGHWLPYSAVVPPMNAARVLPGPYRFCAVDIEARLRQSHTSATNIYRGAGRPEGAVLMERLVDEAAALLGVDPLAFRFQNLLAADALPCTTPTGQRLDSGHYPLLLERCAQAFGYAKRLQALDAPSTEDDTLTGLGMAVYCEPCGSGWESARLHWLSADEVHLFSGSAGQGQGHASAYASIVSETLGVAQASITVEEGDTWSCPPGIGALASRSIAIGGSAVLEAARCALAKREAGATFPIEVETRYTASMEAWSSGAVMVQVGIDTATGEIQIERLVMVDDVGRVIQPALVRGQLLGGMAQGLGQALMERMQMDQAGQWITGTLMDYAVPRASDMPSNGNVTLIDLPSSTQANVLGAKGVGEAGTIGVPAALLNAVCHALRRCGVPSNAIQTVGFPLHSEKIWQLLQLAPAARA